MFELLETDTSMFELLMDGCIVYGDKAVGFQQIEEFIEKVVGILTYKPQEILYIVMIKNPKATVEASVGLITLPVLRQSLRIR